MAKEESNLNKSIQRTVNFLKAHFKINEVILFGSQLSKKADQWSDIDLIVISPDFKKKSFEEIVRVFAELAIKCDSKVELHPYTPEDLKKARPTNFLGYIIKTGKTVYQDDNFSF